MKSYLTSFCLLFAVSLFAQEEESIFKPARVIFYNTENLFDTINSPDTDDEEFLPQSKLQWNSEKYQTKLTHIAQVISSLCDTIEPLVIGLAEVENSKVLEDLIAQPALTKYNLKIVHHDSPDERGIDVALLYDSRLFSVKSSEPLAVRFDFEPNDRTRDVLYVNGMLGKQEVHVFVNHWPSRREGMAKSSPKREAAAQVVRQKVDAILADNPNAKIIIMGDFNDSPTDKSVKQILQAQTTYSPVDAQKLYNLSFNLTRKGLGSHRYDG